MIGVSEPQPGPCPVSHLDSVFVVIGVMGLRLSFQLPATWVQDAGTDLPQELEDGHENVNNNSEPKCSFGP